MSTISANDLQNTSGGIPTVKGQRLIPTAWVNFEGTNTVSIRDSENVSSVTDNSTGKYTVNFAQTLAGIPCAVGGMTIPNYAGTMRCNPSVNSCQVFTATEYSGAGYVDASHVGVAILGGQ
jgi:hypothetical protein